MSKQKILGLDLGSNSLGWALLEGTDGKATGIIDSGCRIFNKAVEEKTPTPKNVKRRDKRLARRVNQRRARRKSRMLNYLVILDFLPLELKESLQPEIILNGIGDPYKFRAAALDRPLSVYEFGRVMLHLVQRRGFLSNRKTLIGDMVDDPDVKAVLEEMEFKEESIQSENEETLFKKDISELRAAIQKRGCRTLGEYLSQFDMHDSKRNRARDGGKLRTDRQMYRDEFNQIWLEQTKHHSILTEEVKSQFEEIIFKQRPLKLRSDRVGKCSLEPKKNRARMGRLEVQKFRYLQDVNNLKFFHPHTDQWTSLSENERSAVVALCEQDPKPNVTKIKSIIGLGNRIKVNLESKDIKPNTTACAIREVLSEWDSLNSDQQLLLVEDLITIQKKSVLKNRLIVHWSYSIETAVKLSLLELEPAHSNLSSKAINKLLPFLEQGEIYSDARVSAGYGYEIDEIEPRKKLSSPPETSNPIVNKGMHELKRVVNAIIKHHGKPDIIRIEMARDLEMNTKRYKAAISQQKKNKSANQEAVEMYLTMGKKNPHLQLSSYPSRSDKLRYRLWKDQGEKCAYSLNSISLTQLFSAEIDIDHIIPYSQSLDDSYMNKVVCLAGENKYKGQRTPIDAFGGNEDKWVQITQALRSFERLKLGSKADRFYWTAEDVTKRDFINSQLSDTRYISKLAIEYVKQLGCDVTTTKGFLVSWLRRQWGLNNLLHEADEKNRSDHRHHAVDAMVIACIDRGFHRRLSGIAMRVEQKSSQLRVRDIYVDEPWESLRKDFEDQVKKIIVSHASQRKITGGLHEETGVGFIESIGGTVYRVDLDGNFKLPQLEKIIDLEVREIVRTHLARFENVPKKAFSEGLKVLHKDGQTTIKRVRVLQSITTLSKLEESKFGARGLSGDVFRWMAYGNTHHVEVIRDKKTGKVRGEFVTAMEASKRAKGIDGPKRPVVRTSFGEGQEFLMALHINDIVTIETAGCNQFYRVQKLESPSRITFREHTAATLDVADQKKRLTINADFVGKHKVLKMTVNSIGKLS